jgi:DNA adenine methylase
MNKYKPFVKWVGGKTQLLDKIFKLIPSDFDKDSIYIEPFVGGGSVFFKFKELFPYVRTIINDSNYGLINAYKIIKNSPKELIECLKKTQSEYSSYSEVSDRAKYYNGKRDAYNERTENDIVMASLFIFLNKTCFNGLYRVNRKGEFNASHSQYASTKFLNEENILDASEALKDTEILCENYDYSEKYDNGKALFYLDPPYKAISKTACFNKYSSDMFDDKDQIDLSLFAERIDKRGSKFILSNSDVLESNGDDFFDELYKGFRIDKVSANRKINTNVKKRGACSEILVTNI